MKLCRSFHYEVRGARTQKYTYLYLNTAGRSSYLHIFISSTEYEISFFPGLILFQKWKLPSLQRTICQSHNLPLVQNKAGRGLMWMTAYVCTFMCLYKILVYILL